MAKDKHVPKSVKEAKLLSKDAENTLYGLMLFLVCLIGILNNGFIGNFLTYIAAYVFGVFYFVPFLIGAFFGIYLILMKKTFLVKVNLVFLGVILIAIASLIGSSFNSANAGFDNLFSNYHATVSNLVVKDTIFNINLTKIDLLGGGLLGRFLATLLVSTITSVGAHIVVAVVMVIGLYLTFAKLVMKIIKKTKEISKNRKEKLAKRLEEEEKIQEEKRKKKEEEKINETTPVRVSNNFVNSNESIGENISKPRRSELRRGETSITWQAPTNNTPTPINEMFADDIEDEKEVKEEKVEESINNIERAPIRTTHDFSPNRDHFSKNIIKPVSPHHEYVYPSLNLLEDAHGKSMKSVNEGIAEERKEIINATLKDFHAGATVDTYTVGPTITRFDIKSSATSSVNAIAKTIDDVAQRLGGVYARFVKVVPGKTTSGLEVPNVHIDMVTLKEVLEAMKDLKPKPLLIPFGKDVSGQVVTATITKFPHMLVAGTSGSGKSVFVHAMILSLLMRYTPNEVRFVIVDPKRVEFGLYRDMPHLLCPIISEPLEAKMALKKLQQEMERRYVLLEENYCTDLSQYNEEMKEKGGEVLPYIVTIIDEYNDLVLAIKDIEKPIVSLGAKARAAGIHICIATQRPSTDVVTGTLKANLATKVAFKVSNSVDSVTILNQGGAERLRGSGDSLIDCASLGASDSFVRVQSPYVDRKEILRVVGFLKDNYKVDYNPEFLDLKDHSAMGPKFIPGEDFDEEDQARYEYLKEQIVAQQKAYVSISFIQQTCRANFNNARDLYNRLQADGIIETLQQGSTSNKGAKVLIQAQSSENSEEKKDED
ncbi:MAG: hypothetical protein J1F32_05905 [Erysipelotrichales bacterium]|nr:hypothetical protein [Erysipelotrichales bacterium]